MNLHPLADEVRFENRDAVALAATLDRLAAGVSLARRESVADAARRAVAEVRAHEPEEHRTRLLRAAMLARLAPYVVQRAAAEFLPGMVGARLPVAAPRVPSNGASVAWVVVTTVAATQRIAVEILDGGPAPARAVVDAAGLAALLGAPHDEALLAWVAVCTQHPPA